MTNHKLETKIKHDVCGVHGVVLIIRDSEGNVKNFTWTASQREYVDNKGDVRLTTRETQIRWDDHCRNGQKSFAITNHYGCAHGQIAHQFPELAHLVRWHLMDERGPLFYIQNTVYLAGDRDCNGLRKGEKKQIISGKTGKPCWELVLSDGKKLRDFDTSSHEKPQSVPVLEWQPVCRIGDGKQRQLDAARQAAKWPEATDEQLCAPPEELTKMLEARLPFLMDDFYDDLRGTGLLEILEKYS